MRIMDIYLRSIARRWKTEIVGRPETKYVFSPYITSSTAESVLAAIAGEPCEIHTLFSAELFVSKSSSLKTIKKLASYGHKMFHLPDLHAKLILVPGAFASIGSQNLTRNGTRNKEATVLIKAATQLQCIEKAIIPWLADRVPITPEMIADMATLLQDISPAFAVFHEAAETADRVVQDKQRQRDAKTLALEEAALRREALQQQEALRLEAIRLQAQRQAHEAQDRAMAEKEKQRQINQEAVLERERHLQQLHRNMKRVQTSLAAAVGIVTLVQDPSRSLWTPERHTLLAQDGRNLTMWSVGAKQVQLLRGNRYLIIQKTGKLGWARVMRTRVTFIEAGMSSTQSVVLAGHYLSINIEADWSADPSYGRNIVFELSDEFAEFATCKISAWFDLDDLTLLRIEMPEGVNSDSKYHTEAMEHIRQGWPAIKVYLLERILKPFVYEHNLSGVDASEFFGEAGTWVRLTAALIGNNPVLLEGA